MKLIFGVADFGVAQRFSAAISCFSLSPALAAGEPGSEDFPQYRTALLMTRRRFIADEFSNTQAAIVGDHADHLIRVLRARVGQEFDIATGQTVRRGRIASITKTRVEFDLGEEVSAASLSEITLLLAIFKFDRMEWAIEKCTELGVSRIIPMIAHRTDSHLAAAAIKRADRWRRLARQAAEQSRRMTPPEIVAPLKLSEALAVPARLRIVLAESEEETSLHALLEPTAAKDGVALAVGPEGGWTEGELQSFQRAGWISASLGDTILRAETAAIAAVAVARELM
jgi:16S rRNA (uracil1498-N3)-methyltransferase